MESQDRRDTWGEIGRQREARRQSHHRHRWVALVSVIVGMLALCVVLNLIYR